MTAKEFQTILQNAIQDNVTLEIEYGIYIYRCKGNTQAFFKEEVDNLKPNSFKCMEMVNETVHYFNMI
jgi:hypothetical protein